ncbi:hypothetical protein F1654_07170 [Alkalicaulis satelles]|uniref:Uncharacterized protein n=1 Tax=Alkalicaulis satelles TaxID=2609175 RepID=A0A5M6ZIQ5_9PROT|nr:hypothetical protein [Alkalicaulis satelles]KAA5803577.1 hypothetical protein F1654_07170 [Alkalicaulis satelles]
MMIRHSILQKIRKGCVWLAFRRWVRPTVRKGGTLKTTIGLLRIEDIQMTTPEMISQADAHAAGYPDRVQLMADIDRPGALYRITLSWLSEDPREALAMKPPGATELFEINRHLEAIDARSQGADWTLCVLNLIGDQPDLTAAILASKAGQPVRLFKSRVRRLKA